MEILSKLSIKQKLLKLANKGKEVVDRAVIGNPSDKLYSEIKSLREIGRKGRKYSKSEANIKLRSRITPLIKTPVETNSRDLEYFLNKENRAMTASPQETHTKTHNLGNGLYHHIHDSTQDKDDFHWESDIKHTLSRSIDPSDKGIASIYLKINPLETHASYFEDHSKYNNNPMVYASMVANSEKGKGLGRKLYQEVINHHGSIQSGSDVSQTAHKAWQSMRNNPKLKVDLGEYPSEGSHKVSISKSEALSLLKSLIKYEGGRGPKLKTLKDNKTQLNEEEKALVNERDAVWDDGDLAVSKATVDGVVWYFTYTHRAYNVCKTLKGAITRFHDFIKGTS